MVKIHYFFDPMCGWCYGATPLVEILKTTPNVQVILHPGGMIKRRAMDPGFRSMAQGYDKKIAELTGQVFSEAYNKRLAGNDTIILDSYITAEAVDVMETYNQKGFEMLKAIQQAHYQLGLDVSNKSILADIASKLGVERALWLNMMEQGEKEIVSKVQHSQLLMNQWSVRGFPTFIREEKAKLTTLPHQNFYNAPLKWQAFIEELEPVA